MKVDRPHLVWVFPDSLDDRLDTATWLETSRELNSLGWEVTLLSRDLTPGPRSMNGVNVNSLGISNLYLIGQLIFHLKVLRYVLKRRNNVDILLFTQISGLWLLPWRLLRGLAGWKQPLLVMDTRDLNDLLPGNLKLRLRMIYFRAVSKMAAVLADGQTAITKRMAQLVHIREGQLWGIWPSGVKPEFFAPAAKARKWPMDGEPIRLIYVGMLLEKRHPLALCEAVIRANDEGLNLELNLYGEGSAAAALRQVSHGSDGKICVMDPVPYEQVPNLLAHSHVGVTSLPSVDDRKYQASSPIKLFEYMAAGMPILATNNVCHTEVVGSGKFAFWVDKPTPEAILGALREINLSRTRLPELGASAQVQVGNWTWRAAAEKLDQALRTGAGQRTSILLTSAESPDA